MLEMKVDKQKNLLRIDMSLSVDAMETKQGLSLLPEYLSQLEPGFSVLTNLSAIESFAPGGIPFLEKMMDLCNQKGVSKVIRVIPDEGKDVGLRIMSCFHYDQDVIIVTCHCLEGAMAKINAQYS